MTQPTLDAQHQVLEAAPPVSQPLATQAPQRQLTVIEHAMRTGATAEQLERLLELQVRADNHQLELMREKRRMDEEDRKAAALLAFRRDFAAFRGENIVIPKSKFVDRGKAGSFWQAEFGLAGRMLSPALSKHGFSIRHDEVFGSRRWVTDGVENDVPWVYVTCYLEHKDGHAETLALEGPPGDATANTPVQNMQTTGSYLKRQSMLAITGTPTEDEDDEARMARRQAGAQAAGLPAAQRREPDEDSQVSIDALIAAGQEKAKQGMKELNSWWFSLTEPQRKLISQDFFAMRKTARQADEGGR